MKPKNPEVAKINHHDLSIDKLSNILVDAILSETFLQKDKLVPLVKSHIKAFINLKNIPKDYNAIESPNDSARRLRTIEKKDAEIKFWVSIVRELDGDSMEKYYIQQHARLVSLGFREADSRMY